MSRTSRKRQSQKVPSPALIRRRIEQKRQVEDGQPPAGFLGSRSRKQLCLNIFCLVLLLGLGTYESAIYYGHQPVPNPDFPTFGAVARKLLSGQMPTDFKRAPGLGFLHVAVSSMMGGPANDLKAAWLINCLLHPLNLVLIWLIARKLLGDSAFWVALVAAINPFLMEILVEPIAEVPLLFFLLLSFYLILNRSSWAYLAAAAMSTIRYEGLVAVFAAFVMDMILRKGWRLRLRALLWASLAALPAALWLLGSLLNLKAQMGTHYFKVMGTEWSKRNVPLLFLEISWYVTTLPLLTAQKAFIRTASEAPFIISKVLTALLLAWGLVWAAIRRDWRILALVLFLVPYSTIHLVHSFILPRYCLTYFWIVLIVCAYGLRGAWTLLDRDTRDFRRARVILLVTVGAACLYWLSVLLPDLPLYARISKRSAYVAYVALGIAGVAFVARLALGMGRPVLLHAALAAIVGMMAVCNQSLLAIVMGQGEEGLEFKLLADWYTKNAKPGEVLVTTLPGRLRMLSPHGAQAAGSFLEFSQIPGKTTEEFIRGCYAMNVTYVAWDSRLGLVPKDLYHVRMGLDRVQMLAAPQDVGPFRVVAKINVPSTRQYINVFRLVKVLGMSPRGP